MLRKTLFLLCVAQYFELNTYALSLQSLPRKVQPLMNESKSCPIRILSWSLRVIKFLRNTNSFATVSV